MSSATLRQSTCGAFAAVPLRLGALDEGKAGQVGLDVVDEGVGGGAHHAGRLAILDEAEDALELGRDIGVALARDVLPDGDLELRILVAVELGLDDQVASRAGVALIVGCGGLKEELVDGLDAGEPAWVGGLQRCLGGRVMLVRFAALGLELEAGFERRQERAQFAHLRLDTCLDLVDWLAVLDELTDGAELGFEFVALLRRDVDPDRTFEILEYLEIGLVDLGPCLFGLAGAVERGRLVEERADAIDHAAIIGRREEPGRAHHHQHRQHRNERSGTAKTTGDDRRETYSEHGRDSLA